MRETITFDASLSEWQRSEIARHFEQTYHVTYEGMERTQALIFRLAYTDPAVVRTEPPAVLLRALAASVKSGASVPVPRMKKPDATRVSELLRQTADRAARDERDHGVVSALAGLCREWDTALKVPQDDYQRHELVRWIEK